LLSLVQANEKGAGNLKPIKLSNKATLY